MNLNDSQIDMVTKNSDQKKNITSAVVLGHDDKPIELKINVIMSESQLNKIGKRRSSLGSISKDLLNNNDTSMHDMSQM